MKLRQLILFAALPLILALCILAYTVQHHAANLGKAQREVIQKAFLAGKETELKSYVMLARHSIAPLYESGRADNTTTDEAKAILARLDYGDDGYFL